MRTNLSPKLNLEKGRLMPITITTELAEGYDGGTLAAEAADGAGLSLVEAITHLRVNSLSDTLVFDPLLAGADIIFDASPIGTDLVIDGDVNNDDVADVTITSNLHTMVIGVDGVNLTLDNVNFDFATTQAFFRSGAISVSAENVTVTNSGTLTASGGETATRDSRVVGVQTTSDDFTLINEASGVIDSAGRHGFEASYYFSADFNNLFVAENATVVNHGLIEGEDDGVRIGTGQVTNTGTIRGTGGYDVDGTGARNFPGQTSDGITATTYDIPLGFQISPDGLVQIDNSATGLIEGARAGILTSGGGLVNNTGIIQGDGYGIITQGLFAYGPGEGGITDYGFTVNNTGTIERLGQDTRHNPLGLDDVAAIKIGGADDHFTSVTINNDGIIRSADMAIHSSIGMTVVNGVTGQILSGTTGNGFTNVAIEGTELYDYAVSVTLISSFLSANRQPLSTQNIVYDSMAGTLTLDGFTYTTSFTPMAVLTAATDYVIIPLIDSAASQAAGELVFVLDGNGNEVYPSTVDVPTTDYGTLTVDFLGGGSFSVTDSSGDLVYLPVPTDVNFDDTIINNGLIVGDIYLGLGSDTVTNNGTINGEIFLGLGDDYFTIGANGVNGDVYGEDGDDRLTGNSAANDLNGEAGNDIIRGNGGADALNGGDGNDYLFADHLDTLSGGEGYDRVIASASSLGLTLDMGASTVEFVRATKYTDVIDASTALVGVYIDSAQGHDTLTGSAQNDRFFAGSGNDVVNAGAGDDIIDGHTGEDTLSGGDGNDVFYVDHLDTLDGGAGYDRLFVRGYSADTNFDLGAAGIEYASGSVANDTFDASSASVAVKLIGRTGEDVLSGGSGADQLYGGVGNDVLNGGAGNDLLNAAQGADSLSGGAGDDKILIDSDDIFIDGGDGYDRVYVHSYSSGVTLDLAAANVEYVYGSGDGDIFTAVGANAAVKMLGQGGDDTLTGGSANDQLFGGVGQDILTGGAGDDYMSGGAGTDSFIFAAGFGNDKINDFDTNGEVLDMSALGITLADLSISALGGSTLIEYGANSIILLGVDVATIDASDFAF